MRFMSRSAAAKGGRETPRRDMELIEQRLREAERIAEGRKS
jgi:hypothetical protein